MVEVAFAGRSNVGKSSLVNALVGRRALARVSSTPGRTRTLNFVEVSLVPGGGLRRLRMVDLPGYGYAKVSKAEKRRWGPMVESYVTERDGLALVILVVDARRPPTDLDVAMAGWLTETGRPWACVVTKLDKLAKTRRAAAVRAAEQALALPAGAAVGFSAEAGIGRDAVWGRILEACAGRD
jgi:GTP-binding protein